MSTTPGTRRTILDAALRLLEGGAGEPLTLEAVAAGAGVSRQTVYVHFANRSELLVAVVEHAKALAGFDAALAPLLAAATADQALDAAIALHLAFTPRVLRVSRALEAERARDPALEKAWEARDSSRRRWTRHVADRLAAEGRLAAGWTAEEAGDLLWALTAPGVTEDLMERRHWSRARLSRRLRDLLTSMLKETTDADAEPVPRNRRRRASPSGERLEHR